MEISDVIERRLGTADVFQLGDITNHLTLVYAPCRTGTLTIGGRQVPGEPRLDPSSHGLSSAYLTEAEVWSTVTVG